MSYIQHIQNNYPHFTNAERKIADLLIKEGDELIYATMSDIKEKAEVGDATIIRFSQKLGYSGFTELKIQMAKDNLKSQRAEAKHDTHSELYNSLVKTLTDSHQMVNDAALQQAVSLIQKARMIYIFGVSSSGNVASILENMFLRVGIRSNAVMDAHRQTHVASVLGADDLVIAFSLSGLTIDIHSALKIAKSNSVPIIAVTNHQDSPIGRQADVVLQTAFEEFINGSSVNGILSQLFVCGALINTFEQQTNIDALQMREKVLRAILDKRLDE